MRIVAITFSPTGGVAKATRLLAEHLGEICCTIDLTDSQVDFAAMTLQVDDLCVIAAPAYGGRIPAPASQRLAPLHGNGAKAVLMAVYGNRAFDDTLLELQDIAQAAGFVPIAGVGAVAEHSLVREFGASRPDAQDAEELATFARKITEALEANAVPLQLPGNRPYKTFGGVPYKPYAGDACDACGLCASHCPVNAIDPANPRATDAEKCFTCMRCVSLCPKGARQIDPAAELALAERLRAACSERKGNQLFL